MTSRTDESVSGWFERITKQEYVPNLDSRMKEKSLNVTYPYTLQNSFFQRLWENIFCSKGFHLLDEVQSVNDHYLYRDACGLVINISKNNKPLDSGE